VRNDMERDRKKGIIDLHTHSNMSDGSDSPAELVRKAKDGGLVGLALTDHDTVQGVSLAKMEAATLGLEFLVGVEIGCHDEFGNLHILGYFRNLEMKRFSGELEWVKKARIERNMKILSKLSQEGLSISPECLKTYAGDDVIGRLHIAKAMLGEGLVKSMKEAFKKYLNVGGRCFVPRKTFTSREAIELIKGYGGLVVMAHPFLIPGQKMELTRIIDGLSGLGIDGIEVYYIENTREETEFLENISKKYNLLPTGGTDYHGVNKPGVRLGVGRGDMSIPYSIMDRILQRI